MRRLRGVAAWPGHQRRGPRSKPPQLQAQHEAVLRRGQLGVRARRSKERDGAASQRTTSAAASAPMQPPSSPRHAVHCGRLQCSTLQKGSAPSPCRRFSAAAAAHARRGGRRPVTALPASASLRGPSKKEQWRALGLGRAAAAAAAALLLQRPQQERTLRHGGDDPPVVVARAGQRPRVDWGLLPPSLHESVAGTGLRGWGWRSWAPRWTLTSAQALR
jgi:hypothetical protein